MTRINVVEPEELHSKHLMGEIHEITRVYGLVRKAQERKVNRYNLQTKVGPPDKYTLGTGHVKFFYDKLNYITSRYYRLCAEAHKRGFNVSPIHIQDLCRDLHSWWFGDYQPTEEAIAINRERIRERLQDMEERNVRK